MKNVIALFLLGLLTANCYPQKSNRYPYLDFSTFNSCNWSWLDHQDNTELQYNVLSNSTDNGFLQIDYKKKTWSAPGMRFLLSEHVVLPSVQYKHLSVSLPAMNSTNNVLSLKVVGIDKNERIVFGKEDSIAVSPSWKDLSIFWHGGDVKALNIFIEYKGDLDTSQRVNLKKIAIKLDQNNIQNTSENIGKFNRSLKSSKIVQLNSEDFIHLLDNIDDIEGKKVVGLGESAHGSQSIAEAQVLFLKNLITQHNCKLVLLEFPFDLSMLFDLYAQGIAPDTSKELIKGYFKLVMDGGTLMTFLEWLRVFNSKLERKVHIAGIDNAAFLSTPRIPLLDYHLLLLGIKKSADYLEKIYNNQIGEVVQMAKHDSGIQSILGRKGFEYYMNALTDQFNTSESQRFFNRDSNMAKRAVKLDTLFTRPEEIIAILGHVSHLQKINSVGMHYNPTCGRLLTERYGKNYYALDFTFGAGKFNQDSCSSTVRLIEDTLRFVPLHSFEHAALMSKGDFFFYSTKYLAPWMTSSMNILRRSQNRNSFHFANLKLRFDGCIFLRNSAGFSDIERSPFAYSFTFFKQRAAFFKKLLKKEPFKP